MVSDAIKIHAGRLLKQWWCSLLLLPCVLYIIHQTYWTLRFNIFFAVSYTFPFPVNFINFLVSNFLLIVHEAGHTFFSVLGIRTVTILGGSLFEVLLPLMILGYNWFNNVKIGIQLSLYLTGFAFVKVAFYAADAGARQLPLIGGLSKEAHDWHNLLSGWGMLEYDLYVGILLVIFGGLCFIFALLIPAFFTNYRKAQLDLNL